MKRWRLDLNPQIYCDLAKPPWRTINDVTMVPREGKLKSRKDATMRPFIFSAPMDTVTGFDLAKRMIELNETPVVSRAIPDEEYIRCLTDLQELESFFAVGLNGELDKFFALLSEAENRARRTIYVNVAIDVAHGDMSRAHDAAALLKEHPNIADIMSGSICTPDAAFRAISAGCTHLRCGVGNGAVCTTRLMTGCGVPNLTAIYLIWQDLEQSPKFDFDPVIIADGGIKHPGCAAKYLAAGATAVMLGSVLSKTREAAGWQKLNTDPDREQLIKKYRGQASADFQKDHFGRINKCPEGVNTDAFYWDGKTYLDNIIEYYRGGMQSTLSYLGLTTIEELNPHHVQFAEITYSGYIEGTPHGATS